MNSSTYQATSAASREVLLADPENRLGSRAALRRLEAEEVRDALLAVSGQLDCQQGGSLLKVQNRAYFFDHTSIDQTDYSSRRRSLYLPVVRNHVYNVLQLMDFADPAITNGDRATTTVAPQALLMLNSPFVIEAAEGLAQLLLAEAAADAERISQLYATCYGRQPSAEEVAGDLAFLAELSSALAPSQADVVQRQKAAWAALCHTLLASNEFIYLR